MKHQKIISFLIILFFGIWFFQYFLSYIPGAYTLIGFLTGITLWLVLSCIVIYQLIEFLLASNKDFHRLTYPVIITVLNVISFNNPTGIVDWEQYEEDDILLVAQMVGTANCATILSLKQHNRFKYTAICFGKDFYFGKYSIKGDTAFLELDKDAPYMDKASYAMLVKSQTDTTKYTHLVLYKSYTDERHIDLPVTEVDMREIMMHQASIK